MRCAVRMVDDEGVAVGNVNPNPRVCAVIERCWRHHTGCEASEASHSWHLHNVPAVKPAIVVISRIVIHLGSRSLSTA
jgi:hypothetical protein